MAGAGGRGPRAGHERAPPRAAFMATPIRHPADVIHRRSTMTVDATGAARWSVHARCDAGGRIGKGRR